MGGSRTEIRTDGAPAPIGPYSQAIEADGWVYCSGQVALLPDGTIRPGGAAAEAEQALTQILAVLRQAGCGAEHVVRTTIFLVDMADFGAVNEVYARLLAVPGVPPSARSTVAVAALPRGARVEIDAVARRP